MKLTALVYFYQKHCKFSAMTVNFSSIDSGFASPAAGEFILPLSPMLHSTNSTNTYPGTTRPILKYNFPATGHPNPQLAEEQLECGLKFRQRSASECFIEASRRLFIGRRSKSEGQEEAVREAKKQTANSILTGMDLNIRN